jgi:hypothetical protein
MAKEGRPSDHSDEPGLGRDWALVVATAHGIHLHRGGLGGDGGGASKEVPALGVLDSHIAAPEAEKDQTR